jgi:iron(III) transport system permease protein
MTVTLPSKNSGRPRPFPTVRGPAGRSLLGRLLLWCLLLAMVGLPMLLLVAIAFNGGDPTDIPPKKLGTAAIGRLTDGNLSWIGDSLIFAVGVTVLATLLGLGLAWITTRTDIPGRGILSALIILPYPMGSMVAAVAWSVLGAPKTGLINDIIGEVLRRHVEWINTYSVPGIIVVEALVCTPVCFLLTQAALRGMDGTLEESSSVLGGSPIRTALRVTLPLMLPAILGAALFTFITALSAFAVPSILGRSLDFHVATETVYRLMGSFAPDYPMAAAVGLVLVLVAAVLVFGVNQVLRRRSHAVIGGKGRPTRPLRLGRFKPLAILFAYGYVLVAVVLPLAAILLASLQDSNRWRLSDLGWSFENYHYVLIEYPLTRNSITNSLIVGVATGVIGVVIATLVALSVDRRRRAGRGGRAMELMAMAPQTVPPLILSVSLLWLVLVLPGGLYGTLTSVLLGFLVVLLPLAYRGMAGVVSQIDSSLEEAARTLGAGPQRTTLNITLPLLGNGVVATAVLLFMLSLNEVGAAIMLSGPDSAVLGPTLFNFYDSGGLSMVSALAVTQVAMVFIAITVVRRLSGRWVNF